MDDFLELDETTSNFYNINDDNIVNDNENVLLDTIDLKQEKITMDSINTDLKKKNIDLEQDEIFDEIRPYRETIIIPVNHIIRMKENDRKDEVQ